MQHVGKCKPLDQIYSPNQSYNTAQHQYTGSTTFISCKEDPISEGEAATQAADLVQAPEETTTTQVTHLATVEIHIKSKHSQRIKPSASTQEDQSRQTHEPKLPKIKLNKDSIKLKDKVHKLLITKD